MNSYKITSQQPLVIAPEDQDVVFESGSYNTVRHGWVYRYVVMQGNIHDGSVTLPSGAVLRWTVGSPEYPGSARIETPSGWHHPHASRGEAAPGYTPRVHPVEVATVVVPLQSKPENVFPAWSIGFNGGDGLDDLFENAMLAIAPGFDFGYGRTPRRHPNAGRSVTEDAFNDNAGFSRWPGGLYDGDKLIAWLVVERADNTSRTLDRFELHVLPEYADRVKLRESYIYTVRVRPDGDERTVAEWDAPKPKAKPSVARIQAIAKERGIGLAEAMKIAEEE